MNAFPPSNPGSPATFAGLPFASQLSLWAVRQWVRAERAQPALHQTIRKGFTLIGAPTAYMALDRFLTLVVHCDATTFTTCRCNDPNVTLDERLFLTCLAHQQQGAVITAYRTLLMWIGPAGARPAMADLLDYGLSLSAVNLSVAGNDINNKMANISKMCG